MDAVADRRQRALEAYFDEDSNISEAIEVATQVKITNDIEAAVLACVPEGEQFPVMYHQMIEAAFRAAGFEVVNDGE